MSVDDNDMRLNAKIGEGKHGWWWAVYLGEGDLPGSLLGGAGSFSTPDKAWAEASDCLDRWRKDRELIATVAERILREHHETLKALD